LVLLRNDGTLPLAVDTHRTIAVVGPGADDPQAQLGDWAGASGQVEWMLDGHPRDTIETVLDGIRAAVPGGWRVIHAPGADIGHLAPDPSGPTYPNGLPRPPMLVPAAPDPRMIAEAVAAAQEADYVVAVVGDNIALTGELCSTATLELVGGQVALLEALAATGTPLIVVMLNSKPAVLPEAALDAAALIQAFNPGMRGGRAVAELVLGQIEPSGRLPVSFPRHVGQQPIYYNGIRGQHGDRYADLSQEPQFAFGEGLSYTTVAYSDLVVHTPEVAPGEAVRAEVRLTNTGARPTRETVQVYISDLVTSVTWAEMELKAFRQVLVGPGESVTVEVELPADSCTLVDADGVRRVEPGAFTMLVGPSSKATDLLTAGFRIDTARPA
jgi:beta-glucosidase